MKVSNVAASSLSSLIVVSRTRQRGPSRLLVLAGSLLLALSVNSHAKDDAQQPKRAQLEAALNEKESRTPAQRKIASQLLFAARKDRGEEAVRGLPYLQADVPQEIDGRVRVRISAEVTAPLLRFIEKRGGTVVYQLAEANVLHALVRLQALEQIAARDEVRFISLPPKAEQNTGVVDSQGDVTHELVGTAGARFRYAVDGTGVKVGVMSGGIRDLAASQNAGELPSNVTVLPLQQGSPTDNEGTAMLEIVHDIAPGAQLFWATGNPDPAQMAKNIRDLHAAGCNIIIDDITYLVESPFQDGPIAQAVNDVSAAGTMVFSSAANSGNKDSGTSSTWEGDFVPGGEAPGGIENIFYTVHSFGSQNHNTNPSGKKTLVALFWNDPLGRSNNDYDLLLTDDAGNVVDMSTDIQDGSQDPFEAIDPFNPQTGKGRRGTRIYIAKKAAAAPRFLHLETARNPLQISTDGSTRGHNASGAANAFSVAAAPTTDYGSTAGPFPGVFTTASQFEKFSSDGPRRIFYEANGTEITPGNLTATGGRLLHKPDITAADGVDTFVSGNDGHNGKGKQYAPFYGTSAAAPHAGAIAALLKSKFPNATPAEIREALMSSALDIAPAGFDRNSGAGIIMPYPALAKLGPPPAQIALVGPAPEHFENPNQAVQKPGSLVRIVNLTIRITGAPAGGGHVRIFTQDGTAHCCSPARQEYDKIDEVRSFGAGDSYITVQTRIYATPNFQQGNGNFTVHLADAANGVITRDQALITIIDTNPASALTALVADEQVEEGRPDAKVEGLTATAQFAISLTQASDRPVTVNAKTAAGTATPGVDYGEVDTAVVFQPGELVKHVRVPVFDNQQRNEAEETFKLQLSGATNAGISDGEATCIIHQPATAGPAVNISTRMRVLNGDNVLIGGFIVTGAEPKQVIIRGIGPSLSGIEGTLADPVLQLLSGDTVIASNDNWRENQDAIQGTGIPPSNDLEAAIVATLNPGAYTAILAGNGGGEGVGVVEVYDLSLAADSELANISTRGFVDTGDNVMIGGFIIGANAESGPSRLLIRALGPSLPVDGRLADPTLELFDGSGTLLATNDNWKESQEEDIRFTTIPPSNDLESAMVRRLDPGAYTAVVRGKDGGVGIGLIEVYKLP